MDNINKVVFLLALSFKTIYENLQTFIPINNFICDFPKSSSFTFSELATISTPKLRNINIVDMPQYDGCNSGRRGEFI